MEEVKIGVWEKKSKNGNSYYGGMTETHWVTVFDNRENKKNPKAPDFQIIMKPKEELQEMSKEVKNDVEKLEKFRKKETDLSSVPF